jgi:hypothetical protein
MKPHVFKPKPIVSVPISYTQKCALCGEGRYAAIHSVKEAAK